MNINFITKNIKESFIINHKIIFCNIIISMKKVIVFQHVHYEDLEKIEEYLLKKDLVIEKIRLYENEDIPKDLSQFSLMI